MTAGQITYFYVAARCQWSKYASKAVDYVRNGDDQARTYMVNVVTVNKFLNVINCYDPSKIDNCLSWDKVLVMINAVMKILGMCGDLESLPETTSNCCNCLSTITILNP